MLRAFWDERRGTAVREGIANDDLPDATEILYRTFSRYKLPVEAEVFWDGVSDTDEALIRSAPLHRLGPGELGRYAFKAMTTWGSLDDFRHFLPRLFELVAIDGGGGWIDPETLFGKLAYGGWQTWPQDERRAIVGFLHALWRNVLGQFPHPFTIDSCLCAIGQAEDDLQGYLEAWDIAASASAACHFATFVEQNVGRISNRRPKPWKLRNPWWDRRAQPAGQVMNWVLAPARMTDLERAFFSFAMDDSHSAGILSDAFNHLSWIRAAAGVS